MGYNDKQLYDTWKMSGRPEDLEAVIDSMSGMIHSEAMKYGSGVVPLNSLIIKGRQLAAEAVKSYSPDQGTKLSVWVGTYLGKLNRYYGQNSILHISEDMHAKQRDYFNVKNSLTQEFDRDPTIGEMADAMSVPENKIMKLEKTFAPQYNDSTLNTAKYLSAPEIDEADLLYAVQNLSESEQKLFKMKTGWPSSKPRNLEYMSMKTGKSKAQISRDLEEIGNKMKLTLRI